MGRRGNGPRSDRGTVAGTERSACSATAHTETKTKQKERISYFCVTGESNSDQLVGNEPY